MRRSPKDPEPGPSSSYIACSDYVSQESAELVDLLAMASVSCRALSRTSEAADAISSDALQHALAGMSFLLESVLDRTIAIKAAADVLYREARRMALALDVKPLPARDTPAAPLADRKRTAA